MYRAIWVLSTKIWFNGANCTGDAYMILGTYTGMTPPSTTTITNWQISTENTTTTDIVFRLLTELPSTTTSGACASGGSVSGSYATSPGMGMNNNSATTTIIAPATTQGAYHFSWFEYSTNPTAYLIMSIANFDTQYPNGTIHISKSDSGDTPFEFSTTTLDTIPASFIYSLFNGTNGAVTPINGFTFTNYPTSTNTFKLETNAALIKGGSMTVIGGVLPTTTDSYGQVAVDDLNAALLAGDLNAIGTSSLYQQSYALFLSTTSTSSVLAYAQRAFPFNLILGLGYAVASFATNTVNTYNDTSHAVTVTMPGEHEIVLLNFASTTALSPVFNEVRGYLGMLTYFMWLLGMTGLAYRLVVGNQSYHVHLLQSRRALRN